MSRHGNVSTPPCPPCDDEPPGAAPPIDAAPVPVCALDVDDVALVFVSSPLQHKSRSITKPFTITKPRTPTLCHVPTNKGPAHRGIFARATGLRTTECPFRSALHRNRSRTCEETAA